MIEAHIETLEYLANKGRFPFAAHHRYTMRMQRANSVGRRVCLGVLLTAASAGSAVVAAPATTDIPDTFGVLELEPSGSFVHFGDLLVLGPDGSLAAKAVPAGSEVTATLDGEPLEAWSSDWAVGRHELEVVASLPDGERRLARQSIVADRMAPELSWQEGGEELLVSHGLGDPKANRRDVDIGKRDRRLGLEWSTDGNNWWPLLVEGDVAQAEGVLRTWTVYADAPQLFLRRRRGAGLADGAPVIPRGDVLVRVKALDLHSAVRTMSLSVVGGEGPTLRIDAVDLVGNRSRVEWPLDRDRL